MTKYSLYENDDEFGIDSFREDAGYIFEYNYIKVKLYKKQRPLQNTIPGDFLGIKSDVNTSIVSTIKINVMSQAPEHKGLNREGRSQRASGVEYNCLTYYNVDIDDGDIIEFIVDNEHGIKSGQKFVVEFKTKGLYQGQYTFKHFTCKAI